MALRVAGLVLLALVSALYLTWYQRRVNLRWPPALAIRLALVGLVLVMMNFSLTNLLEGRESLIEVLLVDVSDSVGPQNVTDFQEIALKWKQGAPYRAVILFGEQARFSLGDEWPYVGTSASDLEAALRLADDILEGRPGRIIVATDGSLPEVSSINEAFSRLEAQGLQIDFIPLEGNIPAGDVYIADLASPPGVWEDSDFLAEVTIFAAQEGSAELGLTINGELQENIPVKLNSGMNTFTLEINAGGSGILILGAAVKSEPDLFVDNNERYAAITVFPPPRVLLVSSTSNSDHLFDALEAEGIDIERIAPEELTTSLVELSRYQAILLDNLLSQQLSFEQQLGLRSFVIDFGRTLMLFGGRSSYNLGGYENSLLEPLLPVDLTPPERIERVPSTYVMVLDRSGSMEEDEASEISPMELTKEAAIRAIESLRPDDYLGVLTFASTVSWEVEISPVGDGMSLRLAQDAISQVRPRGGTLISLALEEAIAQIIDRSQTEYKHILLMSDGSSDDDDDTFDRFSVLAQIALRQNITISTIALGYESDAETMAFIAEEGNGRFYQVLDPSDLPGVMVSESKAAHSENIQLGQTSAVIAMPDHPAVSGFSTLELPILDGYNAVTSKSGAGAADILVSGNFGDPLLSKWQVGLGQVVAWMSDLGAEWAPDMSGWDREGEFWAQVIYASLPDPTFELSEVRVDADSSSLTITLRAFDFDSTPVNNLRPEFVYVDAEKVPVRAEMQHSGIGEYRAVLPLPPFGGYRGVILYSMGGVEWEAPVPFAVNFPEEWQFDHLGQDAANIEHWGNQYGTVGPFAEILSPPEAGNFWQEVDPFSALGVLLIACWPLEIAVRRWKMPWRKP